MKRERKEKPISDEAIDELLKQGRTAADIEGLLKQLTKAVLERALQAELTEHLGYSKHDPAGHHSSNSRNGVTRKKRCGVTLARWNLDEEKAGHVAGKLA